MSRNHHIKMEWASDSTDPDVKSGTATFFYREESPRTAKSNERSLLVKFATFDVAFAVTKLLDRAYEDGKIDGMREVSHAVDAIVKQYGV